jgi:hypothetical protein
VPRAPITRSFEEILCALYPEAPDLARDRLIIGRSVFFNNRSRKAKYPEHLIFAALYLATLYAKEVGAKLSLSAAEKAVWQRRFDSLG